MGMIKLNRQPTPRDLFWFGLLLPLFVAVLGGVLRWMWGLPAAAVVIWLVGAAILAAFALAPPLRRPIYLGWIYASFPIGWTVSHLVLGAVFYLLLTPIGLMMRLCGHDPLHRQFDRQAKSYWIARPKQTDSSRYFRQF